MHNMRSVKSSKKYAKQAVADLIESNRIFPFGLQQLNLIVKLLVYLGRNREAKSYAQQILQMEPQNEEEQDSYERAKGFLSGP